MDLKEHFYGDISPIYHKAEANKNNYFGKGTSTEYLRSSGLTPNRSYAYEKKSVPAVYTNMSQFEFRNFTPSRSTFAHT